MNGLEEVIEDAHDVFRYDKEIRPQDRAHAYLVKNRVRRDYSDTAMECVVIDMIKRAYAIGAGNGSGTANVRRQFAAIRQVAEAALEALEEEGE